MFYSFLLLSFFKSAKIAFLIENEKLKIENYFVAVVSLSRVGGNLKKTAVL